MDGPLVSIIVATYNQERYVEQSLTSALAQDYDNAEVIVADDASRDATPEIIRRMAIEWGPRLVPIFGQENLGPTGNSNRGLLRRRGKYVCFLAGDDLYQPGKIARQVQWMEADDARVACGHDVEAFDDDSGARLYQTSEQRPLGEGTGAAAMLEDGGLFPGLSLMVRSDAIPPYGYDERVGLLSDWKLQLDCLVNGGAYGYVDAVFARYRVHKDALHQRSLREEAVHQEYVDGYLKGLALIESAHPELRKSCARGRGLILFSEARYQIGRGRKRAAREFYRAATRERPSLWWKAAAGISLTVLPEMVMNRLERVVLRRSG